MCGWSPQNVDEDFLSIMYVDCYASLRTCKTCRLIYSSLKHRTFETVCLMISHEIEFQVFHIPSGTPLSTNYNLVYHTYDIPFYSHKLYGIWSSGRHICFQRLNNDNTRSTNFAPLIIALFVFGWWAKSSGFQALL